MLKVLTPVFVLCCLVRFQRTLAILLSGGVTVMYLIGMFAHMVWTLKIIGEFLKVAMTVGIMTLYTAINNLFIHGFYICTFLALIGTLNILLIYKITKFFKVSFGVTLFILFLHLFIVRDFSQMRIGLACNLVIFAFTQTNYLRYFSIIAAIGIHLTSLYLVSIMYVIFNGNPIKVLKDKYFILLLFLFFLLDKILKFFTLLIQGANIFRLEARWIRKRGKQFLASIFCPIFAFCKSTLGI